MLGRFIKNRESFLKSSLLWMGMFIAVLVLWCVPVHADYDGVSYNLNQLKGQFPPGKHWNHYVSNPQDHVDYTGLWIWDYADRMTDHACTTHSASATTGYYDCNCFDGAIQCYGFANRIFYGVFGQLCSKLTKRTDISNIRAGDHIRFTTWGNTGHSAVVWSRNGDTLTLYECNASGNDRCVISFGRQVNVYSSGIVGFIQATNWDEVNRSHSPQPTTYELDVNGWTDNAENGGVANFATFDMYINGSRVANDVSDFCQSFAVGTTYEIKDIKVSAGKAYGGLSSYTRSGFTSGGRTGTLNSNTDVRMTLFTVDPSGWLKNNSPAGISVYNGHSYYFYNTSATWYGAKIVSEYRGGHLVTITSSAENSHIKNMIGNSACWIGTTDQDSEGTWKWVNGEAFSYSNWDNSQPDNYVGNDEGAENFAHIWADYSTWNDNAGFTKYPFVCEIDRAYTVTYNANGGTGALSSQTKAVGQSIKLSSSTPVRAGFKFLGWSTSNSSTSASYQAGVTYSTDANLTLYAVWESLEYTLSFDMNGGSGTISPINIKDGSSCTIPLTIPTRTGYNFLGWSESKTAVSATYSSGATYPGGTATLYAVWKIKMFTISFDSVGGGTIDSMTIEYGKTITALPLPEKRGFFFKGWYTSSETLVTESTVIKSNLSLIAKWSEPTRMTLPATLKTIEEEAFFGTAPNVVVIPDKVTSIGVRAFANNSELYTVVVYAKSISVASDSFANCPNLTVYGYSDTMIDYYCTAKKIPFISLDQTDYISDDYLPVGASVTEEKWTYLQDRTETTTSMVTSMVGWTQSGEYAWQQTGTGTYEYASFPGGFDTGNSLYKKYTNGSAMPPSKVISDTTKREAGNSSFLTYIYWHWTFVDSLNSANDNSNVLVSDVKEYNVQAGNVYRDFIYFDAFESPTDYGTVGPGVNGNIDVAPLRYAWRGIAGDVSHWWWRFEVYQQPYTDYQKVFTYTRTISEEKESSTVVTEGSGIRNVSHLVKYTF